MLSRLLPWPLPALLSWLGAWILFTQLQRWMAPTPALLAACAFGVLASVLGNNWWRRALIAVGFPLALALSGALAFAPWAWLLPLGALLLVYPLHAWRDAPLFPTSEGALLHLPAHAPLEPGAAVLDAGCGLGHGLWALAQAYPLARIHGIERSRLLHALCARRCPGRACSAATCGKPIGARTSSFICFSAPNPWPAPPPKRRPRWHPAAGS